VMPVGDEKTMVTVDPGIRCRGADLAALDPVATAANLEQLEIVPDGSRVYLTCGDDDARAFAGRPPAKLAGARALFLGAADAKTLTGASTAEEAVERLAAMVPTVAVTLGAQGILAITGGRRVDVPAFEARPVVDPTGDRDLLCAAFAWAELRGADVEDAIAWAQLYSRLAMTVPTATGGALTEEQLVAEGTDRGLVPPSGVRA
jgi:sugar/nucleoside kinase (ribokinase family)